MSPGTWEKGFWASLLTLRPAKTKRDSEYFAGRVCERGSVCLCVILFMKSWGKNVSQQFKSHVSVV